MGRRYEAGLKQSSVLDKSPYRADRLRRRLPEHVVTVGHLDAHLQIAQRLSIAQVTLAGICQRLDRRDKKRRGPRNRRGRERHLVPSDHYRAR